MGLDSAAELPSELSPVHVASGQTAHAAVVTGTTCDIDRASTARDAGADCHQQRRWLHVGNNNNNNNNDDDDDDDNNNNNNTPWRDTQERTSTKVAVAAIRHRHRSRTGVSATPARLDVLQQAPKRLHGAVNERELGPGGVAASDCSDVDAALLVQPVVANDLSRTNARQRHVEGSVQQRRCRSDKAVIVQHLTKQNRDLPKCCIAPSRPSHARAHSESLPHFPLHARSTIHNPTPIPTAHTSAQGARAATVT
jgi:hypothetical protein